MIEERFWNEQQAVALAATIVVLYDRDGVRSRAYCTTDEECCFRVVFGFDLGRHNSAFVGPTFRHPQPAATFCRAINAPFNARVAPHTAVDRPPFGWADSESGAPTG
jgi:hypothetical protein